VIPRPPSTNTSARHAAAAYVIRARDTKIFLSYFRSVGTQLDSYTRPGASGGAYLFQVTGSGPAALPGWQPNTCFALQ